MDPAHGYRWLCILVGCVFFLFSILDFPLIWYYLYNFYVRDRGGYGGFGLQLAPRSRYGLKSTGFRDSKEYDELLNPPWLGDMITRARQRTNVPAPLSGGEAAAQVALSCKA